MKARFLTRWKPEGITWKSFWTAGAAIDLVVQEHADEHIDGRVGSVVSTYRMGNEVSGLLARVHL